jgi:hypothetical protein
MVAVGAVAGGCWGVVIVRFAAWVGRSEVRRGPCAPARNSKAEGAHFQAARTAAPHALPPSCNYSRCRSTSHVLTNRARGPRDAPVCCNNCAFGHRSPRHPHSDNQRDTQRPTSLLEAFSASQAASRRKNTALARRKLSGVAITRYNAPTTRSSTTTCEHHRRAPRSWERRSRAPALHTLRHWRFWPPSWRLSSPLPWPSLEGSWARPRATATRKT